MASAFKTKRAELEEEVQEEAHEGACALMHKYFARKTARNQETTLGVRAWLRGYRAHRQGVSLVPGALLPAAASIKYPAIVVAQSVAEQTAGMLPTSLHGSHILARVRVRLVYRRRVLRVVQVAGVALAVERVGTAAVLRTAVHVHAKMGSDENARLPRLQPEGFVVLQQQHAGSACVAVPMNAPAYRQIHVHSVARQCI